MMLPIRRRSARGYNIVFCGKKCRVAFVVVQRMMKDTSQLRFRVELFHEIVDNLVGPFGFGDTLTDQS